MLSLKRFEVHAGSRPGDRRVYARLSDGTLRRVSDPAFERKLLDRYDSGPVPRWYRRLWDWLVGFFKS